MRLGAHAPPSIIPEAAPSRLNAGEFRQPSRKVAPLIMQEIVLHVVNEQHGAGELLELDPLEFRRALLRPEALQSMLAPRPRAQRLRPLDERQNLDALPCSTSKIAASCGWRRSSASRASRSRPGAGEEPGPPPSGARRRPPRDVTVSRLRQILGGSVQAACLARNGKSFVWRALERRNTMHRAPEAQLKSRYESRRRGRRAPAGLPKARPRS